MNPIECPHCRYPLVDDGSLAGQVVVCPACGGLLQMPVPPPTLPPFPPSGSTRPPRRRPMSGMLQIAVILGSGLFGVLCISLARNMAPTQKNSWANVTSAEDSDDLSKYMEPTRNIPPANVASEEELNAWAEQRGFWYGRRDFKLGWARNRWPRKNKALFEVMADPSEFGTVQMFLRGENFDIGSYKIRSTMPQWGTKAYRDFSSAFTYGYSQGHP